MKQIKWVKGSELFSEDQQHALRCFVHRFTGEHKPDWARKPWKDGKPYPVQHATDADWLNETRFAVRSDGRLDQRVQHCEGTPSWPFNPELRKPKTERTKS